MKIPVPRSILLRQLIVIGVLIVFSALTTFSQSILKNKDIIELIKAGLDADVIVEKIKASDTEFDTSTDALIKLTESSVPKAVITAMIKRHKEQSSNQKTLASNENQFIALIPEQGNLTDLRTLKTFYVSTGDSKARERIIKEVAKLGFRPTDSFETADFYMTYEEREEAVSGSPYSNKVGTLDVFMRSQKVGRRLRNIYTTKKEKFYVFTAEPAEAVAKQFSKDFKSK